MRFILKTLFVIFATLFSSIAFAEDVLELSTATVSTVNTFLWLAVVIGVGVGVIVHLIMHKKRMGFDVLIPIIPAILVAFFIIYIPYMLSAPNDFGKICFQNMVVFQKVCWH